MSIEQSEKSANQVERPDIDNKMMDEAIGLLSNPKDARGSENGKELGASSFSSQRDHDIFKCMSIIGDEKHEISKCSSQIPREPGEVFACSSIVKMDSTEMTGDKKTKPDENLDEQKIHDDLGQALKSADQRAIQGLLAEVDTREEMDALDAAVEQLNKENQGTGVDLSVVGRVGNAKLNIHLEEHNNGIGCGGGDSSTNVHLADDSAEATYWTNSGIVQNPEREIDPGNAMKQIQEALKA